MIHDRNRESFRSPENKVSDCALSFAQQRLWFLHQLEPASPAYNCFTALRLRGQLNREGLQKALDTIVERHEVLRTTFSSFDGTPAQVIHAPDAVEIDVRDLPSAAIEQQQKTLDRLMTEITRRPFDLEKDWPLRASLIRLANDEHALLLVTHHIVFDGWSNDVLFRELSALYEALCRGDKSPLDDLRIQYADYAVWQNESLQGEVVQQQLAYWKKHLEDVSPLELPTDRPRPAVLGYHGRKMTFAFPAALSQGLKDLSRQAHSTLFMTLLAAFQTLLHRYTGQDDIAVGCPIAGRNRLEFEGLIGFFINTLVLRNDLSGDPTFRELLERVRTNALDSYVHQDVPFEKLVEELRLTRDPSRSPLAQVTFQLRNYPKQTVRLSGLTVESIAVNAQIARFDLSLAMTNEADGLKGEIEYNLDLFRSATIARMARHFQRLIEGILENPDRRISDLPMLSPTETHRLTFAWNNTRRNYPKDNCLHQLFEAQAERTPESVAVVFEDRRWSYRELNQRANQLARYLQKRGIGPDRLVGVCMDRSPEMVVAVLAVLKAGGAYVPLDARSPTERLRFLLDDTRATVLLTRQACGEGLRRPSGQGSILDSQCAVICLDHDWGAVEKESGANLEGNVAADNLAYVIYTSGSTGRPKGVLIEHQQIVNYLYGIKERFALAAGASYAMAQPLTVDASQTTLWPPLIFGGLLHLVSEERALDGQGLADYMSRFEIDLLKLAPSHLVALQLSSPSPERLLPRRWLIIGGEAAKPAWATRLRAMARCAIFNHYGPTEATVGMLTYSITEGPSFSLAFTVPLGRPLPNSAAYVLGRQCELVPVGVAGELYIGGSCLARGYLNRADFTAEKFIPNPFGGAPGARLYRTGDLARYLPDGNIEFLGRTDDQVKIRGFRIELGEIEAALAEHPSVGQSAALVGEDEANEKRLLCYVVPKQEAMPAPDELRGFLRKKLPEHMVPSAFIPLSRLPRTPHGKLDRNALPAFDENLARPDDKYETPRTPIEKSLSEIWSEILRVERIGIHENFFDLGGHSLMAIRLISRIRDAFKLDLPLRDIFETPTVSGIAQRLQGMADRRETRQETRIGRVERQQYRLQGKK